MVARANWKGFLRIGELVTPVALYTASSTSERIAFHTINRATGHRVKREFIDMETGKPVEREDQVKGYETSSGEYVVLKPEEIEAAIPDSDKVLAVEAFVGCGEIDDVYFDKPYYLAPYTAEGQASFALVRDALVERKAAALARTMLFRRMRTVLIRAHGDGLIGTTLNYAYEVRSAKDAFADIPAQRIEREMLDLAEHIIQTKSGRFHPEQFDDRYEAALAELVRAKIEGRKIRPPERSKPAKVIDLMQALRESAGMAGDKPARKAAPARKKAG